LTRTITRERAEIIARAQECAHCREYNYKKVQVKASSESQLKELSAVWVVRRVCGVCGLETEMGLDADGDVVFLG
jgi:transcription elongation factor Elf1